jgi:hypothetical protein
MEKGRVREDNLPDLLWSFVNLFRRKAQRIDRELDDNEPRNGVRRPNSAARPKY